MTPTCPPNYECLFTPDRPGYSGPWYDAPWAWGPMLASLIVLAILLGTLSWHFWQHRQEVKEGERSEREALLKRQHELAIEEQRTMQLDAAKGNLEVLKLVRS